MKPRIGILTSGGDCPGLNAAIQSAVSFASSLGWETLGFIKGFEGLLEPVNYKLLTPENTRDIMSRGGTILGTTNKGRFSGKIKNNQKNRIPAAIILEAKKNLEKLGVQGLICIGGDGSLSTAQRMFEDGIPVVGIPKTIDNDLSATSLSFGFSSAVNLVTNSLDRLHTTAASHSRVMVVEVMGRYTGWIALHGGISGAADIILIPEIPFSYEKVAKKIEQRVKAGHLSTMVVAAEGIRPKKGKYVTQQAKVSKGQARLGGVGRVLADEIETRTGQETRCVVLGHLQRGGEPTAQDRLLAARYGIAAVSLIRDKVFGQMVSYRDDHISHVSIAEAVGEIKNVPRDHQIIEMGCDMGIYFGF